ncbi:MAG: hypothetical protein WBD40_05960 [Tepidisphaeraceae bacterium]
MLKSGGNVLLLDEPTNDLDVNVMRALEEAMENFAGCAVVISHDRWFLDRVATHILAFEGDSQVVFHEGNYQSYEADRKKRLGIDADQPHRIKNTADSQRRKKNYHSRYYFLAPRESWVKFVANRFLADRAGFFVTT